MGAENDLHRLLKNMNPLLHPGDFVFCSVQDIQKIRAENAIMIFKEQEAFTIILEKEMAEKLQFQFSFVASWIELQVHSALDAVGLTAAFSKALADEGISCNVVAAFYHDHLFVKKEDAQQAMKILGRLSHGG